MPVDGPAIATLHVPMPRQEGVYEIRLAVTRPPGFRERFFPGGAGAPLVERSFQVRRARQACRSRRRPTPNGERCWRSTPPIRPGRRRLPDWTQIRRLPGVSRRPLGSVRTSTVNDPLGVFVELPADAASGEPHWQAYPFSDRIDRHAAPVGNRISERPRAAPGRQHRRAGCGRAIRDDRPRLGRLRRRFRFGRTGRVAEASARVLAADNSPMVLVTNQHPDRVGPVRAVPRA